MKPWAALTGGGFLLVSLFHTPWLEIMEPRWAALMVLGAIGIATTRGIPAIACPMLVFLLYVATSLSWSPDPGEGAIWLARMVAVFGVFLLFHHRSSWWLPEACIIGSIMAMVMVPIWPFGWGGFGNQNWIAEWLILAAPFCCLRWYGVPVALAGTAYMIFGNSTYSEFAGLMAFLLLFLARRGLWPIGAVIVASGLALVILEPTWLGRDLMLSFRDRFELNINGALLWFESPIVGHGMGSFNYEYPRVQEAHISVFPGIFDVAYPERPSRLALPNVFAGALHNEALQCLIELGVMGLILAAWAVWRLYTGSRTSGTMRTAALYSFHAFAAYAVIAFPLQNAQSVIFFAACLGIVSRGTLPGEERSFWWLCPSWLSRPARSAPRFFWPIPGRLPTR